MENILLLISLISGIIWIGLLLFRGKFWLCNQQLNNDNNNNLTLNSYPSVCAIIPARNEEEVIAISLESLLKQNYLGKFSLILINDQSTDKTEIIAKDTQIKINSPHNLNIISGIPLEKGWSGKLWAVNQGINYTKNLDNLPDYFLLTDADIQHNPNNLTALIYKAETEKLALVSSMVKLKCESFWEKLLIPAFIYFFQKLYPFSWVNNINKKMSAAAGGCILIRRDILESIGGISCVKNALIDDCSLAQYVKNYLQNNQTKYKGIWLGLDENTISLRSYNSLKPIWDMVARTAYTQLNYSFLLLIGTVLAMTLIYLIPPLTIVIGIILHNTPIFLISLLTYLLITVSYFPTIKLYNCALIYSFTLPAIAFLYTLMTIDSAIKHWQGKGGAWKGRVY
jgi:hopene-associated glycosyltransferase HpnB